MITFDDQQYKIIKLNDKDTNYAVSTEGVVINYIRKRPLKPAIVRGYPSVKLSFDGIKKNFFIHRLVALAFIPNPENKPQVNHLDENKLNNNIDNLEWVTNQENVEYSCAKVYTFKNPEGEVVKITNLNKFCRENGLVQPGMHDLYTGKAKSYKGWTI